MIPGFLLKLQLGLKHAHILHLYLWRTEVHYEDSLYNAGSKTHGKNMFRVYMIKEVFLQGRRCWPDS